VIVRECKKQFDRFLLDKQNKEAEEVAKREKEAARLAKKKAEEALQREKEA
jgi:hypothetical protein